MTKKVLVLPGDGVGPEVTASAVSILEQAAGGRIEIIYGDIGRSAHVKTSKYLPADTVSLAMDVDAIIVGGVIPPSGRSYQNPVRELKKQLNLYSVVRKFLPLCGSIGTQGVDLLVVNGNPDSILNVIETESLEGVNTHNFLSRVSCEKLFRKTAQLSSMMGRKKITCAHRISMFPLLNGMFVDLFYKELTGSGFYLDDMEIDEAASELVMSPQSMDVIVSTDMFGTVLAGVAAGMVGGSYLTPVGSIGDHAGLFEPMHGPNQVMAGKGMVNPTSAILSGAMAMDHLGMPSEAEKIRKAVRCVYVKGTVTPDVGGTATAEELTGSVIDILNENEG